MTLTRLEGTRARTNLRSSRYLSRLQGSGICPPRHRLSEIAWSWLGAFFGIVAVTVPNDYLHLPHVDNVFLIGSFGASAVLIYGCPLADLAQPRSVVGGHLVCALIGVSVYKVLGEHIAIASGFAVAFALVAMHLTRTLHPPGGATALIAVIGSPQIHQLGYRYALAPVLSGALIMLIVAMVVNNLSANPRRHYPTYWI